MREVAMRPAIAMIELIFAIVVMGIVMMSAPMMISTATKSTTVALQQEGIHEAFSRVSMILTYDWDEASDITDINSSCIPPVLNVSAVGDDELRAEGNRARRAGVDDNSSSHTFKCLTQEFNATAVLGSDGAGEPKDDIDDFIIAGQGLSSIAAGGGGKDYIDQLVVMDTRVKYVFDAADYAGAPFTYNFDANDPPTGGTTNIKAISVILKTVNTAEELDKTITLHAFSCNIGAYEFVSREMP